METDESDVEFVSHEVLRSNLSKRKRAPPSTDRTLKCKTCGKKFSNHNDRKKHELIHLPGFPYACDICKYRGKTKHYLARHKKKVHAERNIKCDHCPAVFIYQCKKDEHMRVHTGEKPYKCDHCPKSFRVPYSLKCHMLIHTDEKPYQCSFCEYACRDNSTLRKHQNKHMGLVQLYNCAICNKSFKHKWLLKEHVSEQHLKMDLKRHPCGQCGKLFKSRTHVAVHAKQVHDRAYATRCPVCNVKVSNKYNLRLHLTSHVDYRPYVCTHAGCHKAFKDRSTLKKHATIHKPELHHPCGRCGMRFSRRQRLVKHLVQHEDRKRDVVCDYCQDIFYSKNYLIQHIRQKHTDVQTCVCDVCGLRTANKPGMILHLKYGHESNQNDRECKICHTKFKRHEYLKSHYYRTHNVRYKMVKPYGKRLPRRVSDLEAEVKVKMEPVDEEFDENNLLDVDKEEIQEECVEYSRGVLKEELAASALRPAAPGHEVEFDQFLVTHMFHETKDEADNIPEDVDPIELQKSNETIDELLKKCKRERLKRENINKKLALVKAKERKAQMEATLLEEKKKEDEAKKRRDEMYLARREEEEIVEFEKLRVKYNERIKAISLDEFKKKENTKIKYFKAKTNQNTKEINDLSENEIDDISFAVKPNLNDRKYSENDLDEENDEFNEDLDEKNDKSNERNDEEATEDSDIGENSKINNKNDNKKDLDEKNNESSEENNEFVEKSDKSNEINDKIATHGKNKKEYQDNDNIPKQKAERNEISKGNENIGENNEQARIDIEMKDNNVFIEENNRKNEGDCNKNDCNERNDDENHQNNESFETNNRKKEINCNINDCNEGNDDEKDKNNESFETNNRKNEVTCNKNDCNEGNDDENYKNNESYENTDKLDEKNDIRRSKRKRKPNKFYETEVNETRNKKMTFKTHQCYVCFKLYPTKEELINHCQVHFEVCNIKTLTKCPICDFVTPKSLSAHLLNKHGIEIKIPFNHLKQNINKNGSKYCYDAKGTIIEVIPSIKILNQDAYKQIDKKNREKMDKSITKTKLVRNGKEWVVEKDDLELKFDLLPQFDVKEYKKLKVSDNYIDRMKQIYILAKKRGLKMAFPCFDCDKICQNLSALKLHNRKHQIDPKPFRPRGEVKKEKEKNKTKKVVTNFKNRNAKPKPIKNKHKCDEELKKFYETNIRGGDIEFWQFLKIFNKMDRENITEFEELEERRDFGIHTLPKNVQNTKNKVANAKNKLKTDLTANKKAGNTKNNTPISETSLKPAKTDLSNTKNVTKTAKIDLTATKNVTKSAKINLTATKNTVFSTKNSKKSNKTAKPAYTRVVMISKKDYNKRIEAKNRLREKK